MIGEKTGPANVNTQYIETLPQRGYRFIAPIQNAVSALPPSPARVAPRIDSLAVLPLENLSNELSEEYFSHGMTEELICAVARIDSLRVISRTSAMLYKKSRKSLTRSPGNWAWTQSWRAPWRVQGTRYASRRD
jgi:hypothetical protein